MLTDAVRTVSDFLARRDRLGPVDGVVLLGNAIPSTAAVARDLFHQTGAKRLIVSGGIGHSTGFLYDAIRTHHPEVPTDGRSEAEILADLLDLPSEAVWLETESTNCGANALATHALLQDRWTPASLLLIQDPTMQRRTHASFEFAWRNGPACTFHSWSPFVPEIVGTDEAWEVRGAPDIWTADRFVSLLLGEIPRLRDDENGYGPRGKGFIGHVDIPSNVEAAWTVVSEHYARTR